MWAIPIAEAGASLLGSYLSRKKSADSQGPYGGEAAEAIGQIPGTIKPYFDPYIQAGRQALPQLMGQYGQLISDPGARMAQLGAGFQHSPGYQFQVGEAEKAAQQAAAAGGMLGSPQEQQQMAQTVGGLANQDYYNYLNHVLGLYGQGLGGMGGIGQMGYQASGRLGEDLAEALMTKANLAAAQQQAQAQQSGGMMGGLGGIASSLGPMLMQHFGSQAGAGAGAGGT